MDQPPDLAFTKALPKVELHAHLTGSISRTCLHSIWLSKKALDPTLPLSDPLTALPSGTASINITTFFPIFDTYIYALVSDAASIKLATTSVLTAFLADGVAYLELRTTPRAIPAAGITKLDYVATVLSTISAFNARHSARMKTTLILSVDRKDSLPDAMGTLDLALSSMSRGNGVGVGVGVGIVGLDLCGNPTRRHITHLSPVFLRAREAGVPLTVHFAEVSTVSEEELELLLSWRPRRLGHVIFVPLTLRREIARRGLGLELCLSCNVQAGMLSAVGGGGGAAAAAAFSDHHFGTWWVEGRCPIALGTDDVGVFESGLSEEYLLAAEHFGLGRRELVKLGRGAVDCIFGDEGEKERLWGLWDKFEEEMG